TSFSRDWSSDVCSSDLPEGVVGLRKLRNKNLYMRLIMLPDPQVTTSPDEKVRYLEDAIGGNRRVDGIPTTQNGSWGATRILRDKIGRASWRARGWQPET